MKVQALRPLLALALDQRGFITPEDAETLGVDPAQLRVLAHRGQLERRGRGVYRFPEVPAGEEDEFLEAVLLVGRGAVVSHESALALLDLADVNPRTVHVTVPDGTRVRRELPKPVTIHRAPLPDDDVTRADGIPVVTVARAIRDGLAAGTDTRLLAQAIVAGRRQGYLTAPEAATLERALDARAGGSWR